MNQPSACFALQALGAAIGVCTNAHIAVKIRYMKPVVVRDRTHQFPWTVYTGANEQEISIPVFVSPLKEPFNGNLGFPRNRHLDMFLFNYPAKDESYPSKSKLVELGRILELLGCC